MKNRKNINQEIDPTGDRTRICWIKDNRPPLWSRGNVVISHVAGPYSIPGRVHLLLRFFPGFSLNLKTKCQEIWATFVPGYLMAMYDGLRSSEL